MSDIQARSFDAPRERSAPASFSATTASGEVRHIQLRRRSLVVAVKPDCDGCHSFIFGDLGVLGDVDVVVVSVAASEEWIDAPTAVLVAPEIMHDLDIRSAPFYVLIDPARRVVISEGVVFGPSQVAEEIAPYL